MDWLSPIRGIFEFMVPVLDSVPAVRAILGFVLVFIVPGFAWTLVLFRQINRLERIALSFGLSIALVTLSVLFTNVVLGISITGPNSLLTILVITAVPFIIYFVKKRLYKNREADELTGVE